MRKTINISVSERMHDEILKRARKGYFSSTSEYIRTLIREDQAKNATPEAVRPLRRANDAFGRLEVDIDL